MFIYTTTISIEANDVDMFSALMNIIYIMLYIYIYIYIIINTHGRFAIAFLPLTTRLSTELFEAVFIEKSSG